jgi:short-subunit dehydrogenase
MQKLIILGACSAIAQAVERELAGCGTEMLLVARCEHRLTALQADLRLRGAREVAIFSADLGDTSCHARLLQFAEKNFAGFDTVLLAYGTMLDQDECAHSAALSLRQLENDFLSAAALLTIFAEHFAAKKAGTIAAITSVAGDRPRRSNYVYGTAKGALSLFLQGLRARLHRSGVRILTIKPGPVDTPMTAQLAGLATAAPPARIARTICRALQNSRCGVVYVPGYWRFVMMGVRAIPEFVFNRLQV